MKIRMNALAQLFVLQRLGDAFGICIQMTGPAFCVVYHRVAASNGRFFTCCCVSGVYFDPYLYSLRPFEVYWVTLKQSV